MTLSGKYNSHVSDIFMAVEVALPGRDDRLRIRFDQVIHDGKIVRRQVPDDIDVVLKQTKINPGGVVVIELPNAPSASNCRILRTAPVNRKVWSTIIFRFLRAASSINSSALGTGTGERLLHENVLAIFEGCFGQLVVGPDRGHDGDRINFSRRK